MSDMLFKKASQTVPGTSRGNSYKGWQLVNISQNYYAACKGSKRVVVGSLRHGNINELVKRFHAVVNKELGIEVHDHGKAKEEA